MGLKAEDRLRLVKAVSAQEQVLEELMKGVREVLRPYTERMVAEVVAGLRFGTQPLADEAKGYTWAEIGEVLGISRQAAQQRFGPAVDRMRDDLIEGLIAEHAGEGVR